VKTALAVSLYRHPELGSGSIVPHARPYRFKTQPRRHILPMRIMLVDKVDLPRPMPVLQLLLPRNGSDHVSKQFIMNKAIDRVFGRVPRRQVVAMLIDALGQVRGHAYVSRAVKFAGQNIDTGLFLFSHRLNNAAKWTLKQVQGDGVRKNQLRVQNLCHPELVSGSIGRLVQSTLRGRGEHHD
jgi:hypothetical protein